MRYEDLGGASNASPGRDDDVERHVRHYGPVGVQEQTWVANSVGIIDNVASQCSGTPYLQRM